MFDSKSARLLAGAFVAATTLAAAAGAVGATTPVTAVQTTLPPVPAGSTSGSSGSSIDNLLGFLLCGSPHMVYLPQTGVCVVLDPLPPTGTPIPTPTLSPLPPVPVG